MPFQAKNWLRNACKLSFRVIGSLKDRLRLVDFPCFVVWSRPSSYFKIRRLSGNVRSTPTLSAITRLDVDCALCDTDVPGICPPGGNVKVDLAFAGPPSGFITPPCPVLPLPPTSPYVRVVTGRLWISYRPQGALRGGIRLCRPDPPPPAYASFPEVVCIWRSRHPHHGWGPRSLTDPVVRRHTLLARPRGLSS